MRFNELKIGDTIHTFNAQTCEYSTRKIVGISAPRFDGVSRDMVIDVTIDGLGSPFICSANAEIVSANGNLLTITPNKDKILSAIETARNGLGNVLNNIETLKQNYEKCGKYLYELNPTLKQQQESSEKIKALETEIKGIKEMVAEIKDLLK